jgi:hypothetical protein
MDEARLAAAEIPPPPNPAESEEETEPLGTPEPEAVATTAGERRLPELGRFVLAANTIREYASGGWRAVTGAVASSLRSDTRGSEPPSADSRWLADMLKGISSAEVARLAEEAKGSLRKAFSGLGSLFTSVEKTPSAAVEPSPVSGEGKKVTATNEELRSELAAVRREKRELEQEIAERTGGIPGSVNVGKVRITTGRRFSGKVLVVNKRHKFVVINIGMNQGMEKGEVLIIHRGSTFVGKVQVIKVYEKMAAADLVADWMRDDVQVNDGVKKF